MATVKPGIWLTTVNITHNEITFVHSFGGLRSYITGILCYYCYVDDTQDYAGIMPKATWRDASTKLDICLADIIGWTSANMGILN